MLKRWWDAGGCWWIDSSEGIEKPRLVADNFLITILICPWTAGEKQALPLRWGGQYHYWCIRSHLLLLLLVKMRQERVAAHWELCSRVEVYCAWCSNRFPRRMIWNTSHNITSKNPLTGENVLEYNAEFCWAVQNRWSWTKVLWELARRSKSCTRVKASKFT